MHATPRSSVSLRMKERKLLRDTTSRPVVTSSINTTWAVRSTVTQATRLHIGTQYTYRSRTKQLHHDLNASPLAIGDLHTQHLVSACCESQQGQWQHEPHAISNSGPHPVCLSTSLGVPGTGPETFSLSPTHRRLPGDTVCITNQHLATSCARTSTLQPPQTTHPKPEKATVRWPHVLLRNERFTLSFVSK